MMPTSPSSPLRFRTAGFPRYGSKAGLSVGACPGEADRSTPHHSLRPTFASPRVVRLAFALSRSTTLTERRRRASGLTALPQGPSLRSGLCCPGPSSLMRPHPPHSPARHNFPARQVICGAFAVPTGGRPRPPASGSELSHSFLLTLPSSYVPGESADCIHPGFIDGIRLRPPLSSGLGTLDCSTSIRFLWSPISGLPGSLTRYGRVELLASLGGPDRHTPATEAFTSELAVESVTLLAVGYNYSGIWVPPPAGLAPAGTFASFAAPGVSGKLTTLLNGLTPKARVTNDAAASPHGPCSQPGSLRHQWVDGLSLRQPSAVRFIYLFLARCVATTGAYTCSQATSFAVSISPVLRSSNPRPSC
jgi:hypothetical protein